MSEPAKKAFGINIRFVGLWILGLFFFSVFLLMGFGFAGITVAVAFATGWLSFLKRTLPGITWNWDLVGMGILCSILILFIAHRSFSWLTQSIANAQGKSWRWHWRWTWCGLSSIIVFFLIGMSVGGTAHQIGWIASSPESLLVSKSGIGSYARDRGIMNNLELGFRFAVEDTAGDVAKVHRKMFERRISNS